jgi:general secretion pathway protein A
LRTLLARNDLRQLAQRITGRYHLNPLTRGETAGYVQHRLRVAGAGANLEIFTKNALSEVHRLAAGIPRVINVICDRALLGAYTQERRQVTAPLVRRAAGEVYGRRFAPPWIGWISAVVASVALGSLVIGAWHAWSSHSRAAITQNAAPVEVTPAPKVATSKPAAAPLAPPSVDTILAAHANEMSNPAAFRRLLSLWGTSLSSDDDACGQAAKRGLSCLTRRGSWGELRVLNRPAILTLTDDHGANHFVVLRELDDNNATLELGEKSEQLPLTVLSRYWFGDFTLVWHPKVAGTRELKLGMRGAEVRWLRRSLATLGGATASEDTTDIYDNDLQQRVQNFQRTHRLDADGIAGIQTLVALDTALAEPGTPTLLAASRSGHST